MHCNRRALALLLTAAFPTGATAAERVVMPYYCTALGRGAVELDPAPGPQSYAVIGQRVEASYKHCAPDDPGRCKTWKVHRFDIDCGGSPVPWYKVVAAASELTGGPATTNGDRLGIRMRPEGGGAEDTAMLPPGFAPFIGMKAELAGGTAPAQSAPPAGAPPVAPKAKQPQSPSPAPAAPAPADRAKSTEPGIPPGASPPASDAAKAPAEAKPSAPIPATIAAPTPNGSKPAPGIITLPSPGGGAVVSASELPASGPAKEPAPDAASATPPAPATGPSYVYLAPIGLALAFVALLGLRALGRRSRAIPRVPVSYPRDLGAISLEPTAPPSADVPPLPNEPELGGAIHPPELPAVPPAPGSLSAAIEQRAYSIELPTSRADALQMLGAPPDASLEAARTIVEGLRQSWNPALASNDDDRRMREEHVRAIDAVWSIVEQNTPA